MQRGIYYGVILLSALALIVVAGTAAGDYTVIWNRTYGEPDAEEAAYAIVADPGGTGFFLAGERKANARVVGLTPEGSEVWSMTYGGEGNATARSIIRTGDGNLLFVGNLAANKTELKTDAWVVRINSTGSEVWNRTYGRPDVNASANAVVETDDGGYLFVGAVTSWGGEGSDAWVVRLNESGDEVWNRTFGGAGNETANAVTRLPGGDFAFAGSTDSSGAGMTDVWVVRLDGSGDEVWNRTFGSPDDDVARAVLNTSDGNLLVAGTFTERPDNATVDTDALLIKLTPAGDIVWNWIYGDIGVDESADAVIETADGGYLFAGETGFPGTDDTDAWLVVTDAEGAVAWSKTFGGKNPGDRAASVLQLAEGGYVSAGTFNATESEGPVNTDAWVVRLGIVPEPTPTATATPTPGPTAAPVKPPKAPAVHQKPPTTTPVPAATTPMTTTAPTKPPTEKPTKTARPTEEPTPTPTVTPTPTPTPTPTVTPTATPTPNNHDGDDHDDDGSSGPLSGTVWYDLNADGNRDPGEPGIPGINVRLIGHRTMLGYTTTGTDGSYRFATIPSGSYAGVEFLMPDGYSCTLPGRDSDARPTGGTVAFAEGDDSRHTLNTGFVGGYQAGTPGAAYGWVRGTVWSDGNRDGVQDENYGLTGVEVRLLDAGGDVVASARTGYHDRYTSMYLFGPLLPGEYSLTFTAPESYIFTDPGGDSYADPLTGTTAPFTVGGGDTVVRDAGLILSLAPVRPLPLGETNEPDEGIGDIKERDDVEDAADEEQSEPDEGVDDVDDAIEEQSEPDGEVDDVDDAAEEEREEQVVTDERQELDGEASGVPREESEDDDDGPDREKKSKDRDDRHKPGEDRPKQEDD